MEHSTTASYKEVLQKFILDKFFPKNIRPTQLEDDFSLIDNDIIDSINLFELIFFIEKTFSFKINLEEISATNFESIENISRFVENKLNVSSPLTI